MTAPWNGGRGTVAVAARYSYTGALFSVLQAQNTLRYGDYQLRADHPVAGGQATAFAFGSLDELGWLNYDQQEYGALQFHRLDLRWRRALGGGRLLVANTLGADWSRSTLFDRPIRMRAVSDRAAARLRTQLRPRRSPAGGDANAQDFQASVPDFGRRPSDLARSRGAFTQGVFATLSLPRRPAADHRPRRPRRPLRRAGRPPHGDPAPAGRRCSRRPTRWRSRPTPGASRRCPACRSASPASRRSASPTSDCRPRSAARWASRRSCRASVTAHVTGYCQRLRLTDVRDIDLMSLDPGAPDFLVSRRGRAYGAELLVRRADAAGSSAGSRTRCRGACAQDDNGVFGPFRLGPAPHHEPGGRLPPARRLLRRRAVPLQHRPPRARDRQRRPVPASTRRSTRWTCASSAASCSIGS